MVSYKRAVGVFAGVDKGKCVNGFNIGYVTLNIKQNQNFLVFYVENEL